MLLSVPGPNTPPSPGEDALSFNISSRGKKAERALKKIPELRCSLPGRVESIVSCRQRDSSAHGAHAACRGLEAAHAAACNEQTRIGAPRAPSRHKTCSNSHRSAALESHRGLGGLQLLTAWIPKSQFQVFPAFA